MRSGSDLLLLEVLDTRYLLLCVLDHLGEEKGEG